MKKRLTFKYEEGASCPLEWNEDEFWSTSTRSIHYKSFNHNDLSAAEDRGWQIVEVEVEVSRGHFVEGVYIAKDCDTVSEAQGRAQTYVQWAGGDVFCAQIQAWCDHCEQWGRPNHLLGELYLEDPLSEEEFRELAKEILSNEGEDGPGVEVSIVFPWES